MPGQDGKKIPVATTEDWRSLAQQASSESDPNKLVELVEHLCDAIDRKKPESVKPDVPRKSDHAG